MDIHKRFRLAYDIRSAINGIQWQGTDQEPDIVAKLVTTLPGKLKKSLQMLLPGHTIKVGGAFIHQKPLVHFIVPPYKGLPNPELGDLLLVCRENRVSGPVYNALLLQAKCVKDVFKASVSIDHQFILYSQWPEFEYVRAGVLNGVRRNVMPKSISQGAQYLLIDKGNSSTMFTATVGNPLEGTTCFHSTVASLIAFERGRTFQLAYPRDMWSNLICDLLKITSNAVFNRRNAGFKQHDRWSGDAAFNYLLLGNGDDVIPIIDEEDDDGYFSGISVICIDLDGEINQEVETKNY